MEKQYVVYSTRVHYEVPEHYISQTLFEGEVLNAENGTLYLCWTPDSTTAFIVPENKDLIKDSLRIVDEVYNKQVPKRPTRLSKDSKALKLKMKEHVSKCEFIGEFPSVKAKPVRTDSQSSHSETESACTYSELIRQLMKARNALVDAYNLQRKFALQFVVYLLADLDILWKMEEPHAVPVMFFYRGYSLSMDIARQLTNYCREECTKRGLDVVAVSIMAQNIQLFGPR